MMYVVKLLVVKEIVEVEVEARYVFVDGNNNLVFQNKALSVGEPLDVINARVWVSVRNERRM